MAPPRNRFAAAWDGTGRLAAATVKVVRRRAAVVFAFGRRYRAELLTATAVLAGWTFLTWALASLVGWRAWPLGAGLLCFSLAGWKFIYTTAGEGLYALTRKGADE